MSEAHGKIRAMPKPLSLNAIRTNLSQFLVDWRDCAGDERQEAQQFVRDLLGCFGIVDRKAALYEKRAERSSTGRQGYIDALIPGTLLIEMKSVGKRLDQAEQQALDYIHDLSDAESPQYVLTCDFQRFRLLDMSAQHSTDTLEFGLEELPEHAEALSFLAGYRSRAFGSFNEERASVEAAKKMAELYEALEGSGYSDHEASVFLVRVLFALFADDSGVWERDLFRDFIENRTHDDGSDLGAQLIFLFQILNQPLERRSSELDEALQRFPYVNGGVFTEPLTIPSFSRTMREKLLNACGLNWAEISPAIFGSLFQSVKSAKARRELGEHYTTETNIKKALDPLILDELNEEYARAKDQPKKLKALLKRLSAVRIFDPACGSGNFLIVAYRELRQLELNVLLRLRELGDSSAEQTIFFEREHISVQLHHIRGIEIEEWPARIAQTALRLVDHQANMEMQKMLGKAPETLPLDTVEVIAVGNSLRMDWHEVLPPTADTVVVGNPPFIGQYLKSVDQTADMKYVWGKEYSGYLDYVTGWYKKAIDYFADVEGGAGRFAFVSTNSIAQGQPVPALFGPVFRAGWRIRFAHQTFPWTSEAPEAAHVHCVIIGFDRAKRPKPLLYTTVPDTPLPVQNEARLINGYLIDGPNVLVEKRMKPLSPLLYPARFGSKPTDGGHLIVSQEAYAEVAADAAAAKYLRPFMMGKELIHNIPRWCLWMEDLNPQDITQSAILRERLEKVRAMRAASKKRPTQELAATPHLFDERHQPDTRYVGIPAVFSEHRPYATVQYLEPEIISGNKIYTCVDPDGFAFAIFSSSMFLVWQKAIGGRLESRPNFSNTVVWNTLPLPQVADSLRQKIIDAGQQVLAARAKHPERSLADHYNRYAMDPELLRAHQALDKQVDRAFGATKPLRDSDQRLALLFENYQHMTTPD